jgi:hypothetical protein
MVQSENTLRIMRQRLEFQAQHRNPDILARIHFPFDLEFSEIRLRGDLANEEFLAEVHVSEKIIV